MAGQFKITGSLHGLKIDGKFGKVMDEALQVLVRQAARAWLRAVIIHVRVYSGFAMGSIKFARGTKGDLASFLNVSVPINPVAKPPRWYYPSGGGRTPKTPERGGAFAAYSFANAQHRYRFNYRNDVIHFAINEFYADVSPTSPWNSMKAGEAAFLEAIDEGVKKLPKVEKYLRTYTLKLLGGAS